MICGKYVKGVIGDRCRLTGVDEGVLNTLFKLLVMYNPFIFQFLMEVK